MSRWRSSRARSAQLGSSAQQPIVSLNALRGVTLSGLEELEVRDCHVVERSEDSLALLDAPRLRTLRFYGRNSLPPAALRGLSANARISSALERLCIDVFIYAPDPAYQAIADEIFAHWQLPALRELELARNWFDGLTTLMFEGVSAAQCRRFAERLLELPAAHPLRLAQIGTYALTEPAVERGAPLEQRFPWPPPRMSGRWRL